MSPKKPTGWCCRRGAAATLAAAVLWGSALASGCSRPEEAAVNPATMNKDQRLRLVEADSSLTPEQKAAKRAQVEELERQSRMARSMAPNMEAPAGLKK